MRHFSLLDQLLIQADRALKTLSHSLSSTRQNPAESMNMDYLSNSEKQHSIALMRVNHAGEIAAQALYYGQSVFSRNHDVQKTLMQAAEEEGDHLAWCQDRLSELGGRVSFLNPAWYVGAFCIGALAGFAGDKISLGFLSETEHQVERHLAGHLAELPQEDHRSRAIVSFMRDDELHHAHVAEKAGAVQLPFPISMTMKYAAKVMTTTAYWV